MLVEAAIVGFLTGAATPVTKAIIDRRQRKTLSQLRTDVDSLTNQVKDLKLELKSKDQTIAVLTANVGRLASDKDDLKAQLKKSESERRTAVSAKNAALRRVARSEEECATRIAALQDEMGSLRAELRAVAGAASIASTIAIASELGDDPGDIGNHH
jgi:chromosome segregation ATPase